MAIKDWFKNLIPFGKAKKVDVIVKPEIPSPPPITPIPAPPVKPKSKGEVK